MRAVEEAAAQIGTAAACRSLGVSRATLYRRRRPKRSVAETTPRPTPPRSLSDQQRRQVLDVLHNEEFADQAPAEVYATLLDRGQYLCSIRTMYRILDDQQEVRERRNQLRHPNYPKPQLVATAPNQVWSWDITKLLGPVKWTYFYLYVILDVFSRYVVGWMLAHRERQHLAERQAALHAAYAAHPERFVHRPPRPLPLPAEVWINPPADRPEPRILQLPHDTNLKQRLSQTG